MTAIPKWDEARTSELEKFVGSEEPISASTVNEAAEKLETSARSVAAKLRKLGYEVEKSSSVATKTFTDVQEDALRNFLIKNSGSYTYAEVANLFSNGDFTAKQIQGKILSMELTDAVKATEKKVYERTFNDKDEATFIKMANDGAFLEEIAEKLKRTVPAVRGKALSLLRTKEITAIPASKHVAKVEDAFAGLDVSSLTVAELAEKLDRTERGVKTMLTRRKVDAKDYSGVAKAEKAAKTAAAS